MWKIRRKLGIRWRRGGPRAYHDRTSQGKTRKKKRFNLSPAPSSPTPFNRCQALNQQSIPCSAVAGAERELPNAKHGFEGMFIEKEPFFHLEGASRVSLWLNPSTLPPLSWETPLLRIQSDPPPCQAPFQWKKGPFSATHALIQGFGLNRWVGNVFAQSYGDLQFFCSPAFSWKIWATAFFLRTRQKQKCATFVWGTSKTRYTPAKRDRKLPVSP